MVLGARGLLVPNVGCHTGSCYTKGSVIWHQDRQTSIDPHAVREKEPGGGGEGQACYFQKKMREHL